MILSRKNTNSDTEGPLWQERRLAIEAISAALEKILDSQEHSSNETRTNCVPGTPSIKAYCFWINCNDYFSEKTILDELCNNCHLNFITRIYGLQRVSIKIFRTVRLCRLFGQNRYFAT